MNTLEDIWDYIRDAVPGYVVGAIVVLVVGWIVAWLISKVVAGAVRRTGLGRRLGRYLDGGGTAEADAAGAAGRVVFYLIMLFVVIAVLDRLQLRLATEPMSELLSRVFAFIPNLIGAAILALLAWILARILRTVVFQLSRTVRLDERLRAASEGETEPAAASAPAAQPQSPPAAPRSRSSPAATAGPAGAERFPLSRGLAEVAFALVFLLFLPAILDALQLGGLLEPVNELLNTVLGFIPNLVAAALILVIGWFIARFVSRLVANLLAAIGTDRLSERVGLAAALGGQRLSSLLGLVVYALILIPVIIAALNALQLPAVTQPASEMLDTLLEIIPRALAAAAILIIGYAVGRIASQLVSGVLAGAGFNQLPARLGFATAAGGAATPGGWTASRVAGSLVMAAFMWFAVIEALEVLGLEVLTILLAGLLVVAGRILLGLIIIAVGLWLARLAARAIRGSGVQQPNLLAFAAQAAILVLFGAMGLRQMGVANEIINLAFAILLGAIGIAVAIAFGVGGRGVAGQLLDRWVARAQTGELDRAAREAMEGGPVAEGGPPIA